MRTEIRIIPKNYGEESLRAIEQILGEHGIPSTRIDYGWIHRAVQVEGTPDTDSLFEAMGNVCRAVQVKEILIVTPAGYILNFQP